ncbi:DUF4878 domain-containing protein [Mycobacterium branderi]|uniref:DUF4878 domain-containing protein n=1 Tax=Mycobacterium branderi TaxID=43348 RepID=A0A7I7WF01_9MYCO|nr:DUF4878 domain-containing protein [Mycobacterium branderi]MCV7236296.1 DUF4878 domain-containing protein [Mycobacterium branderi]ORA35469.1 hypothetical protein BST20_17930 [Mycobacterium branderi]BBZ15181.1 hypothetical protein MBRA_53760 [Mycobacterium branderi]
MTEWSYEGNGYAPAPSDTDLAAAPQPDQQFAASEHYRAHDQWWAPPQPTVVPQAVPTQGGWPPFAPAHYGPPRKSRAPLVITLGVIAVAVTVMVVAVIAVRAIGLGIGGEGSPSDTVKGYLEALSRGDADTALSYSNDQPASKEFLTDDVLKRQITKWPITNIRILNAADADHSFGFAEVHAVATFGDQTSDTTLSVKKVDGHWKLDSATIKLDLSNPGGMDNQALQTLTIFGRPAGQSAAYVFPGWVDLGSSNANLAVKSKPMLLDSLRSTGGLYLSDVTFELSDAGKAAVMSALAKSLEGCTASPMLAPPNCPQNDYDPSIVDGTVVWGTPDLSGVKVGFFDPYRLQATIAGPIVFPLTAQARAGGTKQATTTSFISATADVSTSPPQITAR